MFHADFLGFCRADDSAGLIPTLASKALPEIRDAKAEHEKPNRNADYRQKGMGNTKVRPPGCHFNANPQIGMRL
jgi:hypothetical protein